MMRMMVVVMVVVEVVVLVRVSGRHQGAWCALVPG